ncbi:tetratricopeptide repeat protein 38 isoform X1 [Brachypodium distachyon]|uniref:tetratricopeptide repeat protein 38 isoform X1 n=1 Tax=Brachypodium distachyon TaxID=15368 RepID=UPI00071E0EBD|nr:tetratricopeptide repeat protein 38 isoform X1 [Brachypodium distachyon]|eukprot:XP_014753143.1 tetratricopeptide repeat protein 38 isoform X1 [Brachypodium distachyon]
MAKGEVTRDMWGQEYRTASADCAAALDDYYAQTMAFGRHRGRAVLRAADADPACALASALAAHFVAPRDPDRAAAFLAAAADSLGKATEYERAVFRTLSALVGEDRDVELAIERHFELLKEFPRDLMSLKRAQLICFYVGRPDTSLKFVQQVLPENQDQNYIYGMLAFPLLELGRMDEAERAARKGLAINKNDFWSQHNMCHVFQQECRFREATEFMESCSPSWKACSSFMYEVLQFDTLSYDASKRDSTCFLLLLENCFLLPHRFTHNWWHVAVCYLEGESPIRKVLEVYDQNIMKELERSDCEAAEVYLNALGLLLRLYVRGEIGPAKERLRTLLDELKNESIWHVEWLLDLLVLWALASMNEIRTAENLLGSLRSRVSSMDTKRQQAMQKAFQLAEAVFEYGKGEHKTVFDILGPDFDGLSYKMIGASDEQVDVFNEVWYTVLINARETSTAIEVLVKQISKREGAPFLWRLLEKAYSLEGRGADASVASQKANTLQAAYFH